jgi:NitT/TauT family transport system permease protein
MLETRRLLPAEVKPQQIGTESNAWAIRGSLDRNTYLAVALFGFVTLVLGWWWLAGSGLVDRVFLPTPGEVLKRFHSWLTEDDLLGDVGISVYRVTAGFALSALIALPLGLWIGTFRPLQAFFEPLIEFARYLPAVAFVPLVLLWVGIGEGSKITIIWIGTFFQMVLMITEDVRRVPMAQIEAAQTMGATRGEILRLVVLKSALPAVVDTFRVTMGWAWTYLVVAELVAANSGLGYAILKAQRFLQTDKIFVGILLIGLIGLAMDQAFRLLHRKRFPWSHQKG